MGHALKGIDVRAVRAGTCSVILLGHIDLSDCITRVQFLRFTCEWSSKLNYVRVSVAALELGMVDRTSLVRAPKKKRNRSKWTESALVSWLLIGCYTRVEGYYPAYT